MYNVESEIEETYYDSAEGSSSGASSEEWEDESDSWETDNGPVEEEPGGDNAVVSSPTKGLPADGKSNGVNTSTTESPGAIFTSELPGGMDFLPLNYKFIY